MDADPCRGNDVTDIYSITRGGLLYRFDPKMLQFHLIGRPPCLSNDVVDSMAVSRAGVAYVESENEDLYQVDVRTADCRSLPFQKGQLGWTKFGMGFTADRTDASETLFVADQSGFQDQHPEMSRGLARLDTASLSLHFIAPFSRDIGDGVELAGNRSGKLYALGMSLNGTTSNLAEVDMSTGNVTSLVELPISGDSFALASWGGDLYTFTADNSGTSVYRYDPVSKANTRVSVLSGSVVGVGVSTCAPE